MARVIASFFGTGLILRRMRGADVGSGTVASLFALPLSLLAGHLGGTPAQGACLAVLIVASLLSARPFSGREGDPGWVVIDEAAGTFLSTLGLGVAGAMVGWGVFRVADIWKRAFPGVAPAEGLPGSVGVTADDVVAGLYGLAAGWGVQTLW